MAPSREPTPRLNSDRDIAAAVRPGWRPVVRLR